LDQSIGYSKNLDPQWQDWVTNNVVSGCLDEDMVKTMVDSGFEPVFAQSAITVVRAMTERVRSANPSLLQEYIAEPMKFPSTGNKIRAADRDVRIVFSLANPNVAVIDGILSEQECDKLIQFSSGKLQRSSVVDRSTGGHQISKVRTSEGTHFERAENAVIERLEARISALTGTPVINGEPVQILHYGVGGEYLGHHDYFDPVDPGSTPHLANGGQRIATMVVYLCDVDAGGGTGFPEIELTVRPKKGSAVYFEYCVIGNEHNNTDPRLLHAGLPVERGEKWIATKWIRQRPYVR
jgi:prolyl 4-hydroxylase